jgi:hypothetical protein
MKIPMAGITSPDSYRDRFVPPERVENKNQAKRLCFLIVHFFVKTSFANRSQLKNQCNCTGFYLFVLEAGLEPARPNGHWILSPTCLPIPPLEPNYLGSGCLNTGSTWIFP